MRRVVQGLRAANKKQKYDKISQKKLTIPIETLYAHHQLLARATQQCMCFAPSGRRASAFSVKAMCTCDARKARTHVQKFG